jgi:PAS domain S-box-containing protein
MIEPEVVPRASPPAYEQLLLKRQFQLIAENARDLIVLMDTAGRRLYVSPSYRGVYGDPSHMLGSSAIDHVHPLDRERFRAEFADLLRTGIGRRFEFRVTDVHGSTRHIQSEGSPIRDPAGNVVAVLGIGRDVTEERRTRDALHERESLLEVIFEHAPIGISITDRAGRFVRANAMFLQMLGYSEKELYSLTGWEVTHEDDLERNAELREDLFGGRRTEFVHEKRYLCKDGGILWVQNIVAPIRDADGRQFALALIEDITERRAADAAIHATAERLQALSRRLVDLQEAERREMARELHDRVGQTLTALRINLDLVRRRLEVHPDEEIRERNDDSLDLIDSAFKAVENVMYELRPPLLDEYGLAAPLQWYGKIFAKRTGIRVEVRGDEASRWRPEVELALFRIAQEALTNVARHAKASRVEVEVRQSPAELVLAIHDDGVGLGPRDLPDNRPGYGLIGMRERAEAVGGTLEVASEAGTGTHIIVRVPRT